jgi:hypothetical protein
MQQKLGSYSVSEMLTDAMSQLPKVRPIGESTWNRYSLFLSRMLIVTFHKVLFQLRSTFMLTMQQQNSQ